MRNVDKYLIIDGLQYVNWTRELFEQAHQGGVNAIHVTIAYWENTKETIQNIIDWHHLFRQHADIIMPVRTAADIESAQQKNKVGIIFGLQNCSSLEDNIGNVQILHDLGVRIMQLSYNNQSLLATGCYEKNDSGITRFGQKVIEQMNRVGMIIDMSHSAERSTLEAIEISSRPIVISHANPSFFHDALRNKSDHVLKALAKSGGLLGFSLYPFHLKNGNECTLEDFCTMIAQTRELMGIDRIALGSDLCQNWDYGCLEWMRSGRWTTQADYGEGDASDKAWPQQPSWFANSGDFGNIIDGLSAHGFSETDIAKVMGQNWLAFFTDALPGIT